jgi:hypothetical protein
VTVRHFKPKSRKSAARSSSSTSNSQPASPALTRDSKSEVKQISDLN